MTTSRADGLTPAEANVAARAAAGRRNREIASELGLAENTVEWTLTRIYRKVGVRSRTELAAYFARAEAAHDQKETR